MKNYLKRYTLKCVTTFFICLSVSLHIRAENRQIDLDSIKISVDFKSTKLSDALTLIAERSNLGITFNDSDIKNDSKVTYSAKNSSVRKILLDLLKKTQLNFKYYDENLIFFLKSQQKTKASGIITDEDGVPLPGVEVLEKDTNNGVLTDFDGKFSIDITSSPSILVFTYLGFSPIEKKVTDTEEINLTMTQTIGELNEVVVIGYGTQRKKDLTGAIAHIDLEDKEMIPAASLTQVLQGAIPGLNITPPSGSGQPGSISIRGRTSLSASDSPMIVVDGMIFYGNLTDININDIKSIDVLKDASAAAVYGSRSANGVIVISTKTGTKGKPKFSINAYSGIQSLNETDITHIMNAQQYAEKAVDYQYQQDLIQWYKTMPTNVTDNGGRPERPDITNKQIVAPYLYTQIDRENYLEGGHDINWLDEVFQSSQIQSYNLSISGKTDKTDYYFSGDYLNQKGIVLNDDFERFSFFGKFRNQVTDWFAFTINPRFTHRDYSGVSASVGDAQDSSPLGNKFDENGNYPVYISDESYNYHPLALTNIKDEQYYDNLFLAFRAEVNVPMIPGLKYEVNYSRNYYFARQFQYTPRNIGDGSKVNGVGYKDVTNNQKWLINNIVTYKKSLGAHNFDVTLLHSDEKFFGEGSTLNGEQFSSDKLGYNAMELAEVQSFSSESYEEYTRSYMGRIAYNYNNRYLISGTLRRDGYSGFGPNKKWGNFPSVSAGWVISEEDFLSESKVLDYLKLRLSYGVNGNQGIGRYKSQSQMNTLTTTFDGSTAIGMYSGTMGNNDLGWEKTTATNIGVDFDILESVLTGSLDAYHAETQDVLVQRSIPSISGNSSVWSNIGGMKNHGFEVALQSKNIESTNFNWTSGATFSLNRNKITKLYGEVTEDIGNGWFVGEPIDVYYGYDSNGIWQENDLYDGTIMSGYYPGQWRVVDQNGDGEIDADQDRKILGYSDPNYRFSITNNFRYKGVSLNVIVNSVQGGNGYYMGSNGGVLVSGGTFRSQRLNQTNVLPYWRPDRPVNNAPGIYNNPEINPSVYQSRSFVRLQDVTLAYDFNKSLLKKIGFDTLRVYMAGKNLYTWTQWSGWDPEFNSPLTRTITLGTNISF
ncbi:TonB-linked SusC/RagA family outer membrane protein [Leeuwenhoekiella aestuarii]|uniref:TonB-linked SusC/RagA family outer membrane protein n=1 Tax=Leeuwenhoekiella aestuarii TaxID=2249426 RepID=A0A4Q0NNL0_9FLAO|nr:TonB-dependent receptor [Leeuwenhoekiella aestuarii]RXG11551.1 TonB-linked SusC/RagA family outer membrane protein [Leeuwenhoekiella aestuarii]RXG12068.1 TonB-linked SusC/RagA family outer membrane protein [Leeuwenhoekiella aestuarii]